MFTTEAQSHGGKTKSKPKSEGAEMAEATEKFTERKIVAARKDFAGS